MSHFTQKETDNADKVIATVRSAIKTHKPRLSPVVYFSVWDILSENTVHDLNNVAIKGKVKMIDGEYESEVVENPTWLDLCVLANDMMHCTGDFHHEFFEGIVFMCESGDVKMYSFLMGS